MSGTFLLRNTSSIKQGCYQLGNQLQRDPAIRSRHLGQHPSSTFCQVVLSLSSTKPTQKRHHKTTTTLLSRAPTRNSDSFESLVYNHRHSATQSRRFLSTSPHNLKSQPRVLFRSSQLVLNPANLNMSTAAVAKPSHLAHLASVDLTNYDPEQSRLMDERCILVDDNDRPWGAADKKTCHLMENINRGLLHRAFSAFVFRPSDGKLLLQQRASEKITFPDMWTNTCCSHPLDDFAEEKAEENQRGVKVAASRKLEHELGIPTSQTPIDQFYYLTRIHYLAPSNGLWGEHEIDYILFLTADVSVTPNLNEIRDYKYVSKEELQAMFNDPNNSFTPWFKLIARDFLFGWWDELLARRSSPSSPVQAGSLNGLVDGSKIFRMV